VNRTQKDAPAIAPPPAPALAGEAAPTTYTLTVPRTQQDIDAIRERRSELSNQLESAASRRSEIVEEMRDAEGPVRAGLEQRMSVLDQRILQLEADIAATGRQLTSAPAGLLATTETPFMPFALPPHAVEKISIMFTLFVLAPIAVSIAWAIFRKTMRSSSDRGTRVDGSERLQRLENSVDAIAVEIERISEGQRFVTRLLTEAAPQSASLGAREPASRLRARSETE
jgi:hypothetical protein